LALDRRCICSHACFCILSVREADLEEDLEEDLKEDLCIISPEILAE
jgi:hypothetical protein